MGRLLGLDVGKRRTGIAVTDALQIACSPHATVETSELIEEVLKMGFHLFRDRQHSLFRDIIEEGPYIDLIESSRCCLHIAMKDLNCQEKCIVFMFTRFQRRNHVSHGGTFDTSFDSEAIKVEITFKRGFGDGLGEFDAAETDATRNVGVEDVKRRDS